MEPARPYPKSARISPATGNPICNYRDRLAVAAKSFAQRGSLVACRRFSSTILSCRTRLKSSSSLITAPDASISAIRTSLRRSRRVLSGPAVGQDPETANSAITGGVAEANYGR